MLIRDGVLQAEGAIGGAFVTYDKTTDKWIFSGPGGVEDLGTILTVNETYNGKTLTVTVDDASSVFGSVLYQAADFNFDRADADAEATVTILAMALEAGSGSKKVLLTGQICDTDWAWSAGLVYVSTTIGELTQTPPSGSSDIVQIAGWALSADTIFFYPQLVTVEIA